MSHTLRSNVALQLKSADRPGIFAQLTPALADAGWDIREAAVYGDPESSTFFTRMGLASQTASIEDLCSIMRDGAGKFELDWSIRDLGRPMRVLIAVSKFDHCLFDLMHKQSISAIPIQIVGVVSNHQHARRATEWYGLPFHYLPAEPTDKAPQEAAIANLIDASGAELLILARYMQILSDAFSASLAGRCINIHHSFLPSFKGAKPYHQAHKRGIKLIGATAHYVTPDLDEGPIIEQDVRRVTHTTTADEMIAVGREIEASVLSRAVQWHAEHRVLLNGGRTVVFG